MKKETKTVVYAYAYMRTNLTLRSMWVSIGLYNKVIYFITKF